MAQKQKKIYLTIVADENGIPKELKYNDETFNIVDTIKSMKLFDGAVRWRSNIDNRQVDIFNEDSVWWMY